jgi:hypothetical protein
MFPQTYAVTIVTGSASGAGSGYTDNARGRVLSIRYVKDGTNGYSDGQTITVTNEATGANIWTQTGVNASATVAPRQPTHSLAGVASTYDGTRAVNDYCYLANERVSIALTSAGNSKTGTFYVTVG